MTNAVTIDGDLLKTPRHQFLCSKSLPSSDGTKARFLNDIPRLYFQHGSEIYLAAISFSLVQYEQYKPTRDVSFPASRLGHLACRIPVNLTALTKTGVAKAEPNW